MREVMLKGSLVAEKGPRRMWVQVLLRRLVVDGIEMSQMTAMSGIGFLRSCNVWLLELLPVSRGALDMRKGRKMAG